MAGVSRLQSLAAYDPVELRRECVEVRDRRCRRNAVLVRVLLVREKIEVSAAIWMLLCALECLVRDRNDCDARRQRDCLLRARETDIDAPLVETHRDSA